MDNDRDNDDDEIDNEHNDDDGKIAMLLQGLKVIIGGNQYAC